MIARCSSVFVAVQFLLTVVNCQWTVDVQLHQFENKYNAEIDDGRFCCCDTNTDNNNNCADVLNNLRSNCDDRCDTWFDVSITPCVATDELRCSVSTRSGRIANYNPSDGVDYGYVFHFISNKSPENLSITMLDQEGNNNDNEIDRYTVPLSLSMANQIISLNGENNISVIQLSYQIHCMNLDDCSSTSLTPERSSAKIVSLVTVTVIANLTVCEAMSTGGLITTLSHNVDCSSCPQLLDIEGTEMVIWMTVAIVSLVVAVAALVIFTVILCCKKGFRKHVTSNSKITANKGGSDNPLYEPTFKIKDSSAQQGSNSMQDIYREIDNSLYGSGSANVYAQEGPIRKTSEDVYELATTGEMERNNTYETPDQQY